MGGARRPLSSFRILGYSVAAAALAGLLSLVYFSRRPALEALPTKSGGLGPNGASISFRRTVTSSFDLAYCIIPEVEVFSGGPPKDGIPALTDPKSVTAAKAGYLEDQDRVIGVEFGGEARAYPLRILNYHEVVNDNLGGKAVLVSYCPLCDSALVFDRKIKDEIREFGVSGLLYNSNVLLYDRKRSAKEESLWSQVMMKAVCGPAAREGLEMTLLPSTLSTWEEWKERHPETTALSEVTGYNRDYSASPYGGYFQSPDLMFPVKPDQTITADLSLKDRVIVVQAGGKLKVYPVRRLREAGAGTRWVEDPFHGALVRLRITDPERETVRVEIENPGNMPTATAYSYWFAMAAMQPDAALFER